MKVREKIHHVITKLATDRPLEQITVTDVAREAGISRQSVYRHLGGKAQLDALLPRSGPGTGGYRRKTYRLLPFVF